MNNNNSFTVLYTCLSLLILCFFIFLVANSVVDPQRKKEAIGSLIGAFGFFTGGISPLGEMNKKNLGLALIPLSKDQHLLEDLYEIIKMSGKEKYVKITINKQSLFIAFKRGSIFKRDSYFINKSYKPILLRFYNRLSNVNNLNFFIKGFHNSNLYVASFRAFKIADFFSKRGISFSNISANGELNNSNTVLAITIKGYVKNNSTKEDIIKFGDFKFKAE